MGNFKLKKRIIPYLVFIVALCPNFLFAQNAGTLEGEVIRYDTPSKLPVPRFVSLRFNKVNGRAGPSEDYPIKFVYKRQNLPVKINAETQEWRRITDPDGAIVWVHKRNLQSKRTLIIRSSKTAIINIPLYSKPNLQSKIIAQINNGTICEILKSEAGWRKVKIGNYTGWIIANDAWAS